jgi:DNA helicase HerA-like ATPase
LYATDQRDILLAVDGALRIIWNNTRKRLAEVLANGGTSHGLLPTLIVVDEAHNFIPKEPRGELQEHVANRIYQLASEGRKYGLYLILVSQRPSKLHPGVVPECENSAVLRLQSPDEIAFARDKLGTDMILSGSLPKFRQGRAVVHGQWSEIARDVMIAPARATLGGSGVGNEWLEST